MPATAPQKVQNFSLDKVGGALLLAALTSFVLEAPLKYFLTKIHASPAIYARDLYAFSIIFLSAASWMAGRSLTPTIIALPILIGHMLYGIVVLGSISQPIVALKIFSLFLLGITTYETFKNNIITTQKWMIWMFGLTVTGIAINYFIEMPWKGELFDSAVGEVAVTREWTTGGVSRLSGFARASFDASTFLTVLGSAIALIPTLDRKYRALVIGTTIFAVYATTSKGSLLALVFITPFIYLNWSNSKNRVPAWLVVTPLLLLAIPASLYLFQYRLTVSSQLWALLSSFAERVNWMWPRAFDLMQSPWTIVFGRGLGGIGFPQRFGEGNLYNSADNTMVYLYVTFGAFSIFYVYTIIRKLSINASTIPPYIWNCFLAWLIYWFAYGFTTNIIENGPFSFCLGLIAGAALTKRIEPNNHKYA